MEGERDKMDTMLWYEWDELWFEKNEWDWLWFEGNEWDGLWFEENEWDGLCFEDNEWDGLWFEENERCYDKSRGDVRFNDDVMMEFECYEINKRTEMIKILIYNQYFLLGISGVDHIRLSTLHERCGKVNDLIFGMLILPTWYFNMC